MMKLTINHFARNLNVFNVMSDQPYRELLEDRQDKNFSTDVGTENLAHFMRILKNINQVTFSI